MLGFFHLFVKYWKKECYLLYSLSLSIQSLTENWEQWSGKHLRNSAYHQQQKVIINCFWIPVLRFWLNYLIIYDIEGILQLIFLSVPPEEGDSIVSLYFLQLNFYFELWLECSLFQNGLWIITFDKVEAGSIIFHCNIGPQVTVRIVS